MTIAVKAEAVTDIAAKRDKIRITRANSMHSPTSRDESPGFRAEPTQA